MFTQTSLSIHLLHVDLIIAVLFVCTVTTFSFNIDDYDDDEWAVLESELRAAKQGLYHLKHATQPFSFSSFLDRISAHLPRPALGHDYSTSTSQIVGIRR
jgi:hypothetical protein